MQPALQTVPHCADCGERLTQVITRETGAVSTYEFNPQTNRFDHVDTTHDGHLDYCCAFCHCDLEPEQEAWFRGIPKENNPE